MKSFKLDKNRKHTTVIKAGATVLLLFLMWFLCTHFMEYQRNASNQVNKYRIKQVCLLGDSMVARQEFEAIHTHLKTVKVYFSNDYSGQAKGSLFISVVKVDNNQYLKVIEKKADELANNDYTEFDVDLQLVKGERYAITLSTRDTESGKEPVLYEWKTKEFGLKDKLYIDDVRQSRYLVCKLYYPVTIYLKWMGICLIILAIIFLVWVPLPMGRREKSIPGYVLFYLTPVFTFWIVERFTDNSMFRINIAEALFNILLYYLFFGLLYLIFVSRRASALIGMLIWYILGLGNSFVLAFKGNPIVPTDILSAKTAANVAANYTYSIQPVYVWNLLFILLYFSLLFRMPIHRKTGVKKRIMMAVLIVSTSTVIGSLVIEQNTLKSVGIKNNVWDQKKGYAKNGTFFGFVLNLNSLVQEKPSDYSVEAAKGIARTYGEHYSNQTKKKKGALKTKDGTKPNMIFIMNEAFSDLNVVNPIATNKDYMPFIHGLKKNTIKGNLYMSIFGSGTCNSEFEFLTGDSMSFLQNGIIAYTQIVKDKLPNVTYLLKEQGYAGLDAMHPYLASGWNRPQVYEWMGFENFYSEDAFKKPLMYRKYISDHSNMEKIIEMYENRDDKEKPYYMFNVTMQNHGGFDKIYSNFNNNIHITDMNKNEQAEQYLSLIKKTDSAFKELVSYFSKVKEPTIIVMFGDHQPAIESVFYNGLLGDSKDLSKEDMMKKYITPFIIWANYDIKEKTVDKMSANYLSAYVMQEAGLKMSSYQKFLMDLYKELPVITAVGSIDRDGNYYESALESPYKEKVEEYQIMQYNSLIDTDSTVNSFFYLK